MAPNPSESMEGIPSGQRPGFRERRAPLLVAAALLLAGTALAPFSRSLLSSAFLLLPLLLGASIVSIIVSACLMWMHARIAESRAMSYLALAYGFTGGAMILYMVCFPDFAPSISRALNAGPHASSWLWFTWHFTLLSGIFAYSLDRESDDPVLGKGAVGGATVLFVTACAIAIWAPLPAFEIDNRWSPFFLQYLGPLLFACAVVTMLKLYFQNKRRSLDFWLITVALTIALDIAFSYASMGRFTVGWYVSRIYVLIGASTLLFPLLEQIAQMYTDLTVTATRLGHEATTDNLTALPNRRCFDDHAQRAFALMRRHNTPLSLAVLDIDRFKIYNDTFGHLAGDACLRTVAHIISQEAARRGDFVARFGGEEFVIVLEFTESVGAATVVERIRHAIVAARLPHNAVDDVPFVTVSAGVATMREGDDLARLIGRADEAMYRAKAHGRNRMSTDATVNAV